MGTYLAITIGTMAISLLVGELQMSRSEKKQQQMADEQMRQSQVYSEEQYQRSLRDQEELYAQQKQDSADMYASQLEDEKKLLARQEANNAMTKRQERRAQLRAIYGGK